MELTPQSGPKIVAILNEGFGPPVISIYECDAAQRQAIRRARRRGRVVRHWQRHMSRS
jgi:hypothetical protein